MATINYVTPDGVVQDIEGGRNLVTSDGVVQEQPAPAVVSGLNTFPAFDTVAPADPSGTYTVYTYQEKGTDTSDVFPIAAKYAIPAGKTSQFIITSKTRVQGKRAPEGLAHINYAHPLADRLSFMWDAVYGTDLVSGNFPTVNTVPKVITGDGRSLDLGVLTNTTTLNYDLANIVTMSAGLTVFGRFPSYGTTAAAANFLGGFNSGYYFGFRAQASGANTIQGAIFGAWAARGSGFSVQPSGVGIMAISTDPVSSPDGSYITTQTATIFNGPTLAGRALNAGTETISAFEVVNESNRATGTLSYSAGYSATLTRAEIAYVITNPYGMLSAPRKTYFMPGPPITLSNGIINENNTPDYTASVDSTSGGGTLYWIVQPKDTGTPTAAQIILGRAADDTDATQSGSET